MKAESEGDAFELWVLEDTGVWTGEVQLQGSSKEISPGAISLEGRSFKLETQMLFIADYSDSFEKLNM